MLPPRVVDRDRAGLAFAGLVLVQVTLLVALSFLWWTVRSVVRQRAIEKESVGATAAARDALETLRAEDFARVFALYNDDPEDDPDGPGTAPGARFARGEIEGEIVFPARREPGRGLELREDLEDRELGLPRDLSGDERIDHRDHARDYILLPVEVRVRWTGEQGTHEVRMATQLARCAQA